MRNTSLNGLLVAACLTMLTGTAVTAQAPSPTPEERFTVATREYALMHRGIEQSLGPIRVTSLAADILANASAMAVAIRAERGAARQGDLFTRELAAQLRIRIADALAEHGLTPLDLATDEMPEGVDRRVVMPRVGGAFPWVVGSTTLPCILEVLPPLPPELQYRFVFRDLALVDVHANMIVDILPEALSATGF